ncbi:WGR domain-containing protein [Tautonia marina]|uniref:WGR domain-containing protein n=1 Tax=Tautonia marina TaxID=2653855 RepID=UPI0012610FA6|nr:WGR domain-containing protein [Tautonia marina]
MDNLLTIALEAHSEERNHHRRYEIVVGRDLLDDWTVAIHYGRVGQGGQAKRYASAKADDMKAIVRERLLRRLSAPKRIGCPYRLAAFNAGPGIDIQSWLPGEVMARFFHSAG